MTNIILVLATTILWQLFPAAGGGLPSAKTNAYVAYSASVDRKAVARGTRRQCKGSVPF